MRELKLMTVDSQILNVCLWEDVPREPKAVLQLVHGSAEHMLRYDDFAKFLNKHNIVVVGDDHRGHGKTASDNNSPLGYFSWTNGWSKIVNDEKSVNSFIEKQFPGLPIIMLGHSMGSFMVRDYAIKYSQTIDGAIIMGTTDQPNAMLVGGKMLAKIIRMFNGPKKPSKLLWNMSYKNFNKKWDKKKANGVEWISSDPKVQEEFLADPLCGFVFSNSAFYDMFTGLQFIRKKRNIKLMRRNLPLLIVSGEDDPVGKAGVGPTKVYNKFRNLGFSPDLRIYPKMRHEILNEIGKDEVYKNLLFFINQIVRQNKQ